MADRQAGLAFVKRQTNRAGDHAWTQSRKTARQRGIHTRFRHGYRGFLSKRKSQGRFYGVLNLFYHKINQPYQKCQLAEFRKTHNKKAVIVQYPEIVVFHLRLFRSIPAVIA